MTSKIGWTPAEDRDWWERQPNETSRAFHAFALYRDLGPARSTAKVAHQLGTTKTITDRWSSQHAWVLRSDAWDRDCDQHRREEIRRRHEQAIDAVADIGLIVLDRARSRLEAMTEAEVARLPIRDVIRMYDTASHAILALHGLRGGREIPDDPVESQERLVRDGQRRLEAL